MSTRDVVLDNPWFHFLARKRNVKLDPYTRLEIADLRAIATALSHPNSRAESLTLLCEMENPPYALRILCQCVQDNCRMQRLDLSGNDVWAEWARPIAGMLQQNGSNLTELCLQRNYLADSGATYVAQGLERNTSLRYLDLQDTEIGPSGCRALAQALTTNRALQRLVLSRNRIGDGCNCLGEALKINSSLLHLDLDRNRIMDGHVTLLAGALRTNEALLTLNMDDNDLGDPGIHALAGALCENSTLQCLQLSGNETDRTGVRTLARMLRTSTSLGTLSLPRIHSTHDTVCLAEALWTNTTLHKLTMTGVVLPHFGVDHRLAVSIDSRSSTSGRRLTILDLRNCKLRDKEAGRLAFILKSSSILTELYLQRNLIGNDGAAELAQALRGNNSLFIFRIEHNRIGQAGAMAFLSAMETNSQLRSLGVFSRETMNDECVARLAKMISVNSTLEQLDFEWTIAFGQEPEGFSAETTATLINAVDSNSTLEKIQLVAPFGTLFHPYLKRNSVLKKAIRAVDGIGQSQGFSLGLLPHILNTVKCHSTNAFPAHRLSTIVMYRFLLRHEVSPD